MRHQAGDLGNQAGELCDNLMAAPMGFVAKEECSALADDSSHADSAVESDAPEVIAADWVADMNSRIQESSLRHLLVLMHELC